MKAMTKKKQEDLMADMMFEAQTVVLNKIANALCAKNVKVILGKGGDTAATYVRGGKDVIEIATEDFIKARAFLLHEIGHVNFTPVFESRKSDELKAYNILEDAKVEMLMSKYSKTAKEYLRWLRCEITPRVINSPCALDICIWYAMFASGIMPSGVVQNTRKMAILAIMKLNGGDRKKATEFVDNMYRIAKAYVASGDTKYVFELARILESTYYQTIALSNMIDIKTPARMKLSRRMKKIMEEIQKEFEQEQEQEQEQGKEQEQKQEQNNNDGGVQMKVPVDVRTEERKERQKEEVEDTKGDDAEWGESQQEQGEREEKKAEEVEEANNNEDEKAKVKKELEREINEAKRDAEKKINVWVRAWRQGLTEESMGNYKGEMVGVEMADLRLKMFATTISNMLAMFGGRMEKLDWSGKRIVMNKVLTNEATKIPDFKVFKRVISDLRGRGIKVVVVIDNSGSMLDEAVKVASGFAWAVRRAVKTGGGEMKVVIFNDRAHVVPDKEYEGDRYPVFETHNGTRMSTVRKVVMGLLGGDPAQTKMLFVITDAMLHDVQESIAILNTLVAEGVKVWIGAIGGDAIKKDIEKIRTGGYKGMLSLVAYSPVNTLGERLGKELQRALLDFMKGIRNNIYRGV